MLNFVAKTKSNEKTVFDNNGAWGLYGRNGTESVPAQLVE
jgi:hypothetical protein